MKSFSGYYHGDEEDEDDDRVPLYGEGMTLADYMNQINAMPKRKRKRSQRPKIVCEDVEPDQTKAPEEDIPVCIIIAIIITR